MIRFPVKARTKKQLEELSKPQAVPGGASEAVAWAFHDTQPYLTGVTTNLAFFQAAPLNPQRGNLSPPGALGSPMYFEIYGFYFDVLIPAAAASTPTLDIQQLVFGSGLVNTGAPTFLFTYSSKQYGPWALSLLHGTGGVTGFGNAAAATEYANNSMPDGSFFQDGAICLAPNEPFGATITWPVALALTADIDLRVTMAGVLHRKVV
jgi:hypothetical protein